MKTLEERGQASSASAAKSPVSERDAKAGPREKLRGKSLAEQDGELAPPGGAQGPKEAGRDLKGGIGAIPATRAAALARHSKEQSLVAGVIKKGLGVPEPKKAGVLDANILLRNAAQWIDAGEAKVTVLTPTDADDQRCRGLGDTEVATFDDSVQYPATGGSYKRGDAAGIHPVKEGARGGMQSDGQTLTLIGPADATEVESVLRHEVQHDADQSFKGEAYEQKLPPEATKQYDPKDKEQAKRAAALPSIWNAYQSEFRAFWIMQSKTDDPDLQFGSATEKADNFDKPYGRDTHFQNQRQERIFWYLARNGYETVPSYYATNEAFRTMVDKFTLPASGNLVDSIRVHHLTQAIGKCTPQSALTSAELQAVMTAFAELDKFDRGFLRSTDYSAPFWQRTASLLSPEALAELQAKLGISAGAATKAKGKADDAGAAKKKA